MALIKLIVDLTDPAHPRVVSNEVLNLFPGDRLEFESDPPGTPIAVKLGTTLFALVRNAASNARPSEFAATYTPGGAVTVELILSEDGQGAPPDPPS